MTSGLHLGLVCIHMTHRSSRQCSLVWRSGLCTYLVCVDVEVEIWKEEGKKNEGQEDIQLENEEQSVQG